MGERKNQATLTSSEKAQFVAAVLQLKANGTYDRYVREHRDAMQSPMMPAHGGPAFFPWHREFLRRFERDLQAIDPDVNLPYWDWTVDRLPTSSLWDADFMGGTGQAGTLRVTTGAFAFSTGQWNLTVTSFGDPGPALRRSLGAASVLPRASDVSAAVARTPYDRQPWMGSTNSFRAALEELVHNSVHVWVGGSMATSTSPNDPVFFMHHCNVDRLWAIWQLQHPDQQPYLPGVGGMQGQNLNDPMSPWGGATTPASVLNHRSLGYWYDTDPAPAPTQPSIIDLVIGAPPVQASIGQAGEADLYRFVVSSVADHIIETQGQTDILMSLFGPNSQTALVTEDDDSGQARNARIVSRLTAGTYFVRIRHYQSSSTGSYGVSVRREAAAPAPTPSIPEILVNGPAVQGSLAAASESDLYTFTASTTALYTIETAGNTDTFITLFGPNSQAALVAQDDDSGPGFNSRIEADLSAGVYYARVRHYSPTGTGTYSISIRR